MINLTLPESEGSTVTTGKPNTARLAPHDAEYYYNEGPRHRANIVAVYLFDAGNATVDEAAVVAWMRARLGLAHMFTHRIRRVPLDLDLPRWVPEPDTDPARHVTVARVDGPGWEPLRGHVSRIAGAPVDLTRPPWELHVLTDVTGLDDAPERLTAVVLKFHHSAGDGIATRDLGRHLFGPDPAPLPIPPPTGGPATDFAAAVAGVPGQLVRFGRGLATTGTAARRVRELSEAGEIASPLATRPACRFNGRVTPDLTFDHVRLPLDAITAVRAATPGTTVNDVLLATVSGALSDHLADCGETPASSLAAMVPISLRGTATGAGRTTDGDRATHLAVMSVDLHTDVEDPTDRLRAIAASASREKARNRNEHVRIASGRIESTPAWLLRLAGSARRLAPPPGAEVALHNTMVSNVPWAGTDLTFLGAPVVRVFGVLGIVDGSGLRHLAVTSRPDEVDLTFSTDSAMMADTEQYKRLLLASLDRLHRSSAP